MPSVVTLEVADKEYLEVTPEPGKTSLANINRIVIRSSSPGRVTAEVHVADGTMGGFKVVAVKPAATPVAP